VLDVYTQLERVVGNRNGLSPAKVGAKPCSRTLTRKLLFHVACASVSSLLNEVGHAVDLTVKVVKK
jgi:hypothetical protein